MSNKDMTAEGGVFLADHDCPSLLFSMAPVPAPTFRFYAETEMLFTIHPDGTIERGPAFITQDEASLQFWDLLAGAFPAFRERLVREAEERVRAEAGTR